MARRIMFDLPCFFMDMDGPLPPVYAHLRAPVSAVNSVETFAVAENTGYIGEDGVAVYSSYPVLPSNPSVLYRDELVPYGDTPPAATTLLGLSGTIGAIGLVLALAEGDLLVLGAKGYCRITAGVVVWTVTHTSYTGRAPMAIAVRGTEAMFVYRTPASSTPSGSLWYVTSPLDRSNGTTNPATWPSYTYTIGGSVNPYDLGDTSGVSMLGIEAVALAWSDFDYAVCLYGEITGDGYQLKSHLAFDGPAVLSGGRYICTGYGKVYDAAFDATIGQVTVEVGAAGSVINYVDVDMTPLITLDGLKALAPLPPGYESYNIQTVSTGFGFYTPEPVVVPEFWTDMVRATEIV